MSFAHRSFDPNWRSSVIDNRPGVVGGGVSGSRPPTPTRSRSGSRSPSASSLAQHYHAQNQQYRKMPTAEEPMFAIDDANTANNNNENNNHRFAKLRSTIIKHHQQQQQVHRDHHEAANKAVTFASSKSGVQPLSTDAIAAHRNGKNSNDSTANDISNKNDRSAESTPRRWNTSTTPLRSQSPSNNSYANTSSSASAANTPEKRKQLAQEEKAGRARRLNQRWEQKMEDIVAEETERHLRARAYFEAHKDEILAKDIHLQDHSLALKRKQDHLEEISAKARERNMEWEEKVEDIKEEEIRHEEAVRKYVETHRDDFKDEHELALQRKQEHVEEVAERARERNVEWEEKIEDIKEVGAQYERILRDQLHNGRPYNPQEYTAPPTSVSADTHPRINNYHNNKTHTHLSNSNNSSFRRGASAQNSFGVGGGGLTPSSHRTSASSTPFTSRSPSKQEGIIRRGSNDTDTNGLDTTDSSATKKLVSKQRSSSSSAAGKKTSKSSRHHSRNDDIIRRNIRAASVGGITAYKRSYSTNDEHHSPAFNNKNGADAVIIAQQYQQKHHSPSTSSHHHTSKSVPNATYSVRGGGVGDVAPPTTTASNLTNRAAVYTATPNKNTASVIINNNDADEHCAHHHHQTNHHDDAIRRKEQFLAQRSEQAMLNNVAWEARVEAIKRYNDKHDKARDEQWKAFAAAEAEETMREIQLEGTTTTSTMMHTPRGGGRMTPPRSRSHSSTPTSRSHSAVSPAAQTPNNNHFNTFNATIYDSHNPTPTRYQRVLDAKDDVSYDMVAQQQHQYPLQYKPTTYQDIYEMRANTNVSGGRGSDDNCEVCDSSVHRRTHNDARDRKEAFLQDRVDRVRQIE